MGTHFVSKSPNFGFLASYEPHLAHAAATAERYVFDEPRYALLQLRIFGEVFARQVAARSNLHTGDREDQIDRLRRVRDLGLLDHQKTDHSSFRAGSFVAPPLPVDTETALTLESMLGLIRDLPHRSRSQGDALHSFDQSVLAKAFGGELVPQDPSGEPASTLLERIRAEREVAAPKTRKKARRRPRRLDPPAQPPTEQPPLPGLSDE